MKINIMEAYLIGSMAGALIGFERELIIFNIILIILSILFRNISLPKRNKQGENKKWKEVNMKSYKT